MVDEVKSVNKHYYCLLKDEANVIEGRAIWLFNQ